MSLRWSVSKQKETFEVNSPFLEQKINKQAKKKKSSQWTNNDDDNRNHTRDRLIRLSSFTSSLFFFFLVVLFFPSVNLFSSLFLFSTSTLIIPHRTTQRGRDSAQWQRWGRNCRSLWTQLYPEMGTKQENSGGGWPGGWGSHRDVEVDWIYHLPAPQHTKRGWQELGQSKTSICPGGPFFYYSSCTHS